MVECMVAASKLGADLVLLNTGLAARAIEEIVNRHKIDAIFVDNGFEPEVRYVAADIPRISIHPNSATPQRRLDGGAHFHRHRRRTGAATETTRQAGRSHLGHHRHTAKARDGPRHPASAPSPRCCRACRCGTVK